MEDVNDNVPEFVNLPYYAAVQVEAVPGSVIFRVSAVDRDYGPNGEVTYSLKMQQRNFEVKVSFIYVLISPIFILFFIFYKNVVFNISLRLIQ